MTLIKFRDEDEAFYGPYLPSKVIRDWFNKWEWLCFVELLYRLNYLGNHKELALFEIKKELRRRGD
jgi:hypothetical protein